MNKWYINLDENKEVEASTRMFRIDDIKEIGFGSFPKNFLFNLRGQRGYELDFKLDDELNVDDMPKVHYKVFKNQPFDARKLSEYVVEQIQKNANIIFLPYFKDETRYDIEAKLKIARELKESGIKTFIAIEIHYNIDVLPLEDLKQYSNFYEFVSFYVGSASGGFNLMRRVIQNVNTIRQQLSKYIICNSMPTTFYGENRTETYFLPVTSLIADIWIKFWKIEAGGGGGKVKLLIPDKKFKYFTAQELSEQEDYMPNKKIAELEYTPNEYFSISDYRREQAKKIQFEIWFHHVENLEDARAVISFIRKDICPLYRSIVEEAYFEKIIMYTMRKSKFASQRQSDEVIKYEKLLRKSSNDVEEYLENLNMLCDALAKNEEIEIKEIKNSFFSEK